MGRQHSFLAGLERAARAAARAQREADAAQRRRERERQRLEPEAQRRWQQLNKSQREQYLVARQSETDQLNAELSAQLEELRGILVARQAPKEDSVFACLAPKRTPPVLSIPAELNRTTLQPVKSTFIGAVKPLAWWEGLLGLRSRFIREVATAEQQFQKALFDYEATEKDRNTRRDQLRQEYDQQLNTYKMETAKADREIADLQQRYRDGPGRALRTGCARSRPFALLRIARVQTAFDRDQARRTFQQALDETRQRYSVARLTEYHSSPAQPNRIRPAASPRTHTSSRPSASSHPG